MTQTSTAAVPPSGLSPSRFDPIHSSAQMAELISAVTHQAVPEVLQRLREEFADPGISVARDFEARGVQRYVMTEQMLRFYSESDGFLFELAIWNRNSNKRLMCRRILDVIKAHRDGPVDVLSIGDGLGFDCLEFSRAGHHVTYFELPGKTEACAGRVFKQANAPVRVLTDTKDLQPNSCDVLVCLDTLEHVPDPPEMVGQIAGYLRPGGLLFVHAPFYMIHPRYPTHLKSSRKYSGSLKLFSDHGLQAISGDLFWNPLVLAKPDTNGKFPASTISQRFVVRSGAMLLTLGRIGLFPRRLVHKIRCRGNRWFDKSA